MFKQHTWCLTIWLENVNDTKPFPFDLPKRDPNSSNFIESGVWNDDDRTYTAKGWKNFQPKLSAKGIIFIAAGIEVTQKNQRAHLQTVVVYEKAKTFKQVKNQFPTAHIEYAKGTLQENIRYCLKDGVYHMYTKDKQKSSELTEYDNSELSTAKVLKNVDWRAAGSIEDIIKRLETIEVRMNRILTYVDEKYPGDD